MVSFTLSPLNISKYLTNFTLVGICTLSYPMGTTQFGDLGGSKSGSQQDSRTGTEVEICFAAILNPSRLSM
jgi:hypothetical protein